MELIIIALGAVACGYLIYRRANGIWQAQFREYLEKTSRSGNSRQAQEAREVLERITRGEEKPRD